MRGFLMALALWAGLFSVEAQAQGQFNFRAGRLEDPVSIGNALAAMPFNDKAMGYKNLGERFERIGLRVKRVDIDRLTATDEKDDPLNFKRGDVYIRFLTDSAPTPVQAICPLATIFHFVKRGSRWIPQDRTANWLLNGHGHCKAPE